MNSDKGPTIVSVDFGDSFILASGCGWGKVY